MAEYHVGCGISGRIYAGILKKSGDEWSNKSDVTDEAISSVAEHMYGRVPRDEDSITYKFHLRNGKDLHLKLSVVDQVG